MLSNPKWSEDKRLELSSVIAWLRTKSASDTYDWGNGEACAMAQFQDAMGLGRNDIAPWYSRVTQPAPHTYGAALKRAEKLAV
jgi:hypothetical protein